MGESKSLAMTRTRTKANVRTKERTKAKTTTKARTKAKQWQGRGQHQIKGKVNGPAKTLFRKQGKGTGRRKTEGRARPRTGRGKERKDKTTQKGKAEGKAEGKTEPTTDGTREGQSIIQ